MDVAPLRATAGRTVWRAALATGLLALLGGCVSLTADPRALIYEPGGIAVQSLYCDTATKVVRAAEFTSEVADEQRLDTRSIRLVTWNVHKEDDKGWEADLTVLSKSNDIVLLQEVTLLEPIQQVLRGAGMRWIMASSFIYDFTDIGVLTATRTVPVATCTQRVVEPLLRIPKSSVLTWLRLSGVRQVLAVANIHAINFTLNLDAYRAQLAAMEDVLMEHEGPIILAGDFNTWSEGRLQVLRETAMRLQLIEINYGDDRRAIFFGSPLDHVFVRGLDVVTSRAIPVTSSDHNPVEVTLRFPTRAPPASTSMP